MIFKSLTLIILLLSSTMYFVMPQEAVFASVKQAEDPQAESEKLNEEDFIQMEVSHCFMALSFKLYPQYQYFYNNPTLVLHTEPPRISL